MELFIGNLPENTTLAQVVAYFKGLSGKVRFQVHQKKLEDDTIVCFAVADFDNDKYAAKFAERYAGSIFYGRKLTVREYVHRSYNNERRAVNWREKPWRAGERRVSDRRLRQIVQQEDEIEKLSKEPEDKRSLDEKAATLKVDAYKDFARKN